jgi:hypothetical protein
MEYRLVALAYQVLPERLWEVSFYLVVVEEMERMALVAQVAVEVEVVPDKLVRFCTDGTGDGGGGGGGGGQGGTGGTGGTSGGGASIAVYTFNNGSNGVFDDDEFFIGTAGIGGAGGTGGTGGTGGAGGSWC